MFDRCIKCERLGQDCVPNLMALSFSDLMEWWKKRQSHLGWTNQYLAEISSIPLGTINRIKAGEDDCRYSTMRCVIHALMGGYAVEFPCQKKLDQEFASIDALGKQCEELKRENEKLTEKLQNIHTEEKTKIDHLLNEISMLRNELDYMKLENDRKAKIIDKYLGS